MNKTVITTPAGAAAMAHSSGMVVGAVHAIFEGAALIAGDVVRFVYTGMERAEQRRRLRGLDDRLLNDIGLSRGDVSTEVEKPFWRA